MIVSKFLYWRDHQSLNIWTVPIEFLDCAHNYFQFKILPSTHWKQDIVDNIFKISIFCVIPNLKIFWYIWYFTSWMLFLWCLFISLDAKTDVMLEKYEACIIYFQKKQRVLYYSYCISVLLFWLLSICIFAISTTNRIVSSAINNKFDEW